MYSYVLSVKPDMSSFNHSLPSKLGLILSQHAMYVTLVDYGNLHPLSFALTLAVAVLYICLGSAKTSVVDVLTMLIVCLL